jgi:hypothetical protein
MTFDKTSDYGRFMSWAASAGRQCEEVDGGLIIAVPSSRGKFSAIVWFSDQWCEIVLPNFDDLVLTDDGLQHALALGKLNYSHGLARFGIGPDGKEIQLIVAALQPSILDAEFFAMLVASADKAVADYEEQMWGDSENGHGDRDSLSTLGT